MTPNAVGSPGSESSTVKLRVAAAAKRPPAALATPTMAAAAAPQPSSLGDSKINLANSGNACSTLGRPNSADLANARTAAARTSSELSCRCPARSWGWSPSARISTAVQRLLGLKLRNLARAVAAASAQPTATRWPRALAAASRRRHEASPSRCLVRSSTVSFLPTPSPSDRNALALSALLSARNMAADTPVGPSWRRCQANRCASARSSGRPLTSAATTARRARSSHPNFCAMLGSLMVSCTMKPTKSSEKSKRANVSNMPCHSPKATAHFEATRNIGQRTQKSGTLSFLRISSLSFEPDSTEPCKPPDMCCSRKFAALRLTKALGSPSLATTARPKVPSLGKDKAFVLSSA
mmetsp:Transcript_160345/g.514532  ORF Transcript_160345/g.514532 Transcript_160345/m.514532 type:complete len:353 (-) Transcript_160345:633-1691(-)